MVDREKREDRAAPQRIPSSEPIPTPQSLRRGRSKAHGECSSSDLIPKKRPSSEPFPTPKSLRRGRSKDHRESSSDLLKPTEAELRKYFCSLSLDLNTAHRSLKLTNNNKTVAYVEEDQPYPDHEDRFDSCPQILCSSGLTGRCYWEVEWSGGVDIAVCYRKTKRKGDNINRSFGYNSQSWSLYCNEGVFTVRHKGKAMCLPHSPPLPSGTVGVYLDYEAGSLSYYKVSSFVPPILIHTFNTTFTAPLFPGFGLHSLISNVGSMTLLDGDCSE